MWSNNTWPSLKISDKTNTLYTGSTLAHMGRITYTSQYMCTHRTHTFISTDKCAQAVEQMAHLFTVDRKANLLLYLWFYACNSACGCENMWANVCLCVCNETWWPVRPSKWNRPDNIMEMDWGLCGGRRGKDMEVCCCRRSTTKCGV